MMWTALIIIAAAAVIFAAVECVCVVYCKRRLDEYCERYKQTHKGLRELDERLTELGVKLHNVPRDIAGMKDHLGMLDRQLQDVYECTAELRYEHKVREAERMLDIVRHTKKKQE